MCKDLYFSGERNIYDIHQGEIRGEKILIATEVSASVTRTTTGFPIYTLILCLKALLCGKLK
jgi:hypothetical protein